MKRHFYLHLNFLYLLFFFFFFFLLRFKFFICENDEWIFKNNFFIIWFQLVSLKTSEDYLRKIFLGKDNLNRHVYFPIKILIGFKHLSKGVGIHFVKIEYICYNFKLFVLYSRLRSQPPLFYSSFKRFNWIYCISRHCSISWNKLFSILK